MLKRDLGHRPGEFYGLQYVVADLGVSLHQAMFEVPNPDVPNNTVVEVVQDGFVIGDRVLRPAMVGVAKGGAKAGANASAESQAEQTD